MGHRRRSREYALQGLYMYEISRPPIGEILPLGWVDRDIPPDIRDFAEDLIRGAVDNIGKIDELIVRYSKNWKFERLSIVDKSILRLSIYSLLYHPEIPAPVTINEAIELGKIYGGEGSGQFINGILDAVRKSEIKEQEQC